MGTKQLRQRLAAFFITCSLVTLGTLAKAQVIDSNHASVVGTVQTISCDSSDFLLIGGTLSRLNGHSRTNLGKVHKDGTLDYTFKPDPFAVPKITEGPSFVSRTIRQSDGKYLVNGLFATIAGQNLTNLVRFNADDTVDTDFNPLFTASDRTPVAALALQEDGKIIIGGDFRTVDGQNRSALARLNADGSLDTGFSSSVSDLNAPSISSIYLQADGKILIRGSFTAVGNQLRTNFARLHPNGTLDTNFNAAVNGSINCMAFQANGQILLGGFFTSVAGQPRTNLARLNEDGTLDTSFNPAPDSTVTGVTLQTDGKILVCGSFTTLGGQSRTRLGRLNADGTLDGTFIYTPASTPNALSIQEDGKVLVGSIRLHNTSVPVQSLSVESSAITWLREGTSPELLRTRFEGSHDGTNWTALGAGQRVTGGWQISGEGFTEFAFIRAVGTVQENTCTWTVQSVSGPLRFVADPQDRTNNAGTIATFRAQAIGTVPLNYQWYKNDAPLTNTANISLAHTPTLVLTNVMGADMGNYFLVASNASGSITSTVARLTVIDPLITIQPANQATNAGQSVQFAVGVLGTAPFSYQWRKDGMMLVGGTNSTLTVSNVQVPDISDYDVIVSNLFGSTTSRVATLRFLANADALNPNVSDSVFATAVQSDGGMILGGSFFSVSSTARNHVARLSPDGTLDKSFNPIVNRDVFSTAIQPDGKILIGGWFSQVSGQPRDLIARLNPNGTLDPTFHPVISGNGGLYLYSGVYSLALRPDGKILIAGDFRTVNGHSRTNIAQLLPDGSLDTNFVASANDIIYPMALQADGKILVGGNFTSLCGTTHSRLGRLHPDGTLDTTFTPTPNDLPLCLAVQPDGKILVGGVFTSIAGTNRNDIARLNPDGTIDGTFNAHANSAVRTISLQSDGKIVVGGSFSSLSGQARSAVGRLEKDGTFDPSFNPAIEGNSRIVYSLTHQVDGKILIGGSFTSVGEQTRNNFARLLATEPAIESLTINSNNITLFQTGPGPEYWRVEVDVFTNGSNWVHIGSAQPTPMGWELSGIDLPPGTTARTRSLVAGGRYNASGWFAETGGGPPCILRQPTNQTNGYRMAASFTVEAGGAASLGYQWYKDGTKVTNSLNTFGANTSLLVLTNLSASNVGGYTVVITNSLGSITSEVAQLTVLNPAIISHPVDLATNAGGTGIFTATVSGTQPNFYQWFKDGVQVSSGFVAGQTLVLTFQQFNVRKIHEGNYWLTLSNSFGMATSSVARLTVQDPYISSHPLTQMAQGGTNVTLNTVVVGTLPLSYQWQKEGIDLSAGTTNTFTITNIQTSDAGLYRLIASNDFGSVTSQTAVVTVNAAVLDTFNPGSANPIDALAIQADGKVLSGSQSGLQRFFPNGTADTNFNVSANSEILAIAIQADGKIVVGGTFTNLGGVRRNYIGRVTADGTIDPTYDPSSNQSVWSLAIQPDGKILAGGAFTTLGGTNQSYLARIETNGTVDSSFKAAVGGAVQCIAIQPDGQILIGNGSISRFNPDGTRDTNFVGSANNGVDSIAVQKDGRILVGGPFISLSNQNRARIGRLLPDGTIDSSFAPTANMQLSCLTLQANGKIIIGGYFTNVSGALRRYIARLDPDGNVDSSFVPEVTGSTLPVAAIAVQTNGQIVIGGNFTSVAGQARKNIARLNSPEPVVDLLDAADGVIHWTRQGSSPELSHVTFDTSIDGEIWTALGTGTRTIDGWGWTGSPLPTPSFVRARGWVPGESTSAWIIEKLLSLESRNPLILVNGSEFGFVSNTFGFNIQGRSGELIILEGSTDLSNWVSVATNTIGSGPTYFSDPDSTNLSERYYRTRTP